MSSFKYTFLVHFMKISIHLHIFWPDSKSTQLSLDKYRKDLHSTTTSASALFCTLCPPLHFNSFNCVKLNHKSKINYSYYNDCDDVYDFQSLNEREFPPLFAFADPQQLHPKVGSCEGMEVKEVLDWHGDLYLYLWLYGSDSDSDSNTEGLRRSLGLRLLGRTFLQSVRAAFLPFLPFAGWFGWMARWLAGCL